MGLVHNFPGPEIFFIYEINKQIKNWSDLNSYWKSRKIPLFLKSSAFILTLLYRVFPPPPNPTGAPWGPHPHPPWGWGIDFEKPRGWGILTETPWGFGGGFTWFFILFRQKKLAFLLIFEKNFLHFYQKFFQHPPFYFIKLHFVTVYNKNYD